MVLFALMSDHNLQCIHGVGALTEVTALQRHRRYEYTILTLLFILKLHGIIAYYTYTSQHSQLHKYYILCIYVNIYIFTTRLVVLQTVFVDDRNPLIDRVSPFNKPPTPPPLNTTPVEEADASLTRAHDARADAHTRARV